MEPVKFNAENLCVTVKFCEIQKNEYKTPVLYRSSFVLRNSNYPKTRGTARIDRAIVSHCHTREQIKIPSVSQIRTNLP